MVENKLIEGILRGQNNPISSICKFGNDQLVSGDQVNTVKIWNLKSRRPTLSFTCKEHEKGILKMSYQKDLLITQGREGTIIFREIENLNKYRQCMQSAPYSFCKHKVKEDGEQLYYLKEDHLAEVYSIKENKAIGTVAIDKNHGMVMAMDDDPINSFEFAMGYEDATVEYFDVRKLEKAVDSVSIDTSKMTTITALGYHQGDVVIGTASQKGVVIVDRQSKEIKGNFAANGKGINCILTDHSRWVLFGGWDYRIHCVDMKKYKLKGLLKYHRGSVHDMMWLNSNEENTLKLASCSEDEHIVLWRIPLQTKAKKKHATNMDTSK